MDSKFSMLMEKHAQGELTAAEAAVLAQKLMENPRLAEEFAAASRLEADLGSVIKEKGRTALYTRRLERTAASVEPETPRKPLPVRRMAVAAGLAALIGVSWAFLNNLPQAEKRPEVAKRKPSAADQGIAAQWAALAAHPVVAESGAMKRKLRRFATSGYGIRSVPFSQAVARLQSEWHEFDHRDKKDKEAVQMEIAAEVKARWKTPEEEPKVSLELPGLSLLSSVHLVAAQAGLTAAVTDKGVTFAADRRREEGEERTWKLPLAAASVNAWLDAQRALVKTVQQEFYSNNLNAGFSLVEAGAALKPSWLPDGPWSDYGPKHAVTLGMVEKTGVTEQKFFTPMQIDPPQIPEKFTSFDWSELPAPNSVDTLPAQQAVADEMVVEAEITEVAAGDGTVALQTGLTEGTMVDYVRTAPEAGWEVKMADDYANMVWMFDTDAGANDLNMWIKPMVPEIPKGYKYRVAEEGTLVQADLATSFMVKAAREDIGVTLNRLLAVHGIPEGTVVWDRESNTAVAKGAPGAVRRAAAALAAVQEISTAGIAVTRKTITWKDGVIVEPVKGGGPLEMSGEEVRELLQKAKGSRIAASPVSECYPSPGMRIMEAVDVPLEDGLQPAQLAIGLTITVTEGQRSGTGCSLTLEAKNKRLIRHQAEAGGSEPVIDTKSSSGAFTLEEDEWVRYDYPAEGEAEAMTVLVNVKPVTMAARGEAPAVEEKKSMEGILR